MSNYVNYNKHGQAIGHNSVTPANVKADGSIVTFDGDPSRKTWDEIDNLVSHSVVGEQGTLHCVSADAAAKVAATIERNPNYSRK